MNVRLACDRDAAFLAAHDQHIAREELEYALARRRVYLAEERGAPVGWLRFNLFWDNTPFCNLLFVSEQNRGAGVGSALLGAWESDARGGVCRRHDLDAGGRARAGVLPRERVSRRGRIFPVRRGV